MDGVVEPDRAHLDEDAALDLLAGRIPAERAPGLDAHLERCRACRQFLVQLARLSEHRATEPAAGRDAPGDALVAGARIDRYVIEDLLGAGAMGMVYAARDPELER